MGSTVHLNWIKVSRLKDKATDVRMTATTRMTLLLSGTTRMPLLLGAHTNSQLTSHLANKKTSFGSAGSADHQVTAAKRMPFCAMWFSVLASLLAPHSFSSVSQELRSLFTSTCLEVCGSHLFVNEQLACSVPCVRGLANQIISNLLLFYGTIPLLQMTVK